MSKADELVLCKYIENPGTFKPTMDFLTKKMDSFSWQRRADCETNTFYKQVIPYVMLYDVVKDSFLAYYRKTGDGRLIGSTLYYTSNYIKKY